MKTLIIAPHPDDDLLGCGGVMAKRAGAGGEVHVVVVTRGLAELFTAESIAQTRDELARAHRLLGVANCSFLDFPAPELHLTATWKVADAIGAVIGRLQPDEVFLPCPSDIHRDHHATFHAAAVAIRPLKAPSVRAAYLYETLSESEWANHAHGQGFLPTVWIDIGAQLERKLEALGCLESQLFAFPHPRSLEAVRAQARLRGSATGMLAAESFQCYRALER